MMRPIRINPFALVLGGLAADRFPPLVHALSAAGRDPRNRDEFLLVREVSGLLQELRPEEGFGAAAAALGALVHAAFLFWLDREQVVALDETQLSRILSAPSTGVPASLPSGAAYIQLPALRIWGVPVEGGSPEPLDGWFRIAETGELTVVAIFGLHPGREGFTVVEVRGTAPGVLGRPDGSARFSPTLEGGDAAGLASVQGEEELLELAWRVEGDL